MSTIFSLVRASASNTNYIKMQKETITKYIEKNNIDIDEEVAIEVNYPKEEEKVIELLKNFHAPCTIIVADLTVFGRTVELILEVLRYLLDKKIRIIAINQNFDLIEGDDMITKMILGIIKTTVRIEKDLMSLRTKEALDAKKAEGINLGKPKGTIQKSKFDNDRDKIEELLGVGLSVRKISKLLGYNNHIGLNNYVKKRDIRIKVKENPLQRELLFD